MITLKEAVLKSLKELNVASNHATVCEHIINNQYYDFKDAKTPLATVSANLGNFIRSGDTRVKRIKQPDGTYLYYLTVNESNIDLLSLNDPAQVVVTKQKKAASYNERDLHKLLSSYLKNTDIYSKTIFHEQSTIGSDSHQKWIHPDMVGVQFLNLKSVVSQTFLKSINRVDTFKLSSFEIKKEINTDYELKKSFFQAVSNSSWANYGYLVAFEISDTLMEEMERLNQSFGIGIIRLKVNPYESKVLFTPKYRDLDFKTIDKLCKINKNFEGFIEQAEKLLTANERYVKATEKELTEFCDDFFHDDSEFEKYSNEKNIPTE